MADPEGGSEQDDVSFLRTVSSFSSNGRWHSPWTYTSNRFHVGRPCPLKSRIASDNVKRPAICQSKCLGHHTPCVSVLLVRTERGAQRYKYERARYFFQNRTFGVWQTERGRSEDRGSGDGGRLHSSADIQLCRTRRESTQTKREEQRGAHSFSIGFLAPLAAHLRELLARNSAATRCP
jgi:hypothetical protein